MNIIEFATQNLGLTLWPGQETILRAFYGQEMPERLLPLWREISRLKQTPFHGSGEYAPGTEMDEGVFVLGRRSGKSTLATIIMLYEKFRHQRAVYVSAVYDGRRTERMCERLCESSGEAPDFTLVQFNSEKPILEPFGVAVVGDRAVHESFSLNVTAIVNMARKRLFIASPRKKSGWFYEQYYCGANVPGRLTVQAPSWVMHPHGEFFRTVGRPSNAWWRDFAAMFEDE